MSQDTIFAAWREAEDPELAVQTAIEDVERALASSASIDRKIADLEAATEPLLDAPGGNPMLAAHAARALVRENAVLERTLPSTEEQRLRRRVRLTVVQARGLHCAGESDLAFRAVLAALTATQNAAKGRAELLAQMGNVEPNVFAECVIAVLGIGAASLRRAELARSSRETCTERFRELVLAYIPDLKDPSSAQLYPGTPSLVQVMYLFTEHRISTDAGLVRALHGLDKVARGTDRRSLATIPLREVAVAGFEGDRTRLIQQRALARPKLEEQPLPRHLKIVGQYLDED
jgi:hypothetical protein